MSTDPNSLRRTMRLWSCGVTVVTCLHEGERSGMTASSFTSIALEPPLILVCLHKQAHTTQLIVESKRFAISILGAHQEEVSSQFAGYTPLPEGEDRFYKMEIITGQSGLPLLADAIAWLECDVYGIHDGGTHHVITGEVMYTHRKDDPVLPLVYHNRAYRAFNTDED